MFKTGDLVYVPQAVHRFMKNSLNDKLKLDYYKSLSITEKPMLGIFKQFTASGECVVAFSDGSWMINLKDIYHHDEEKSDRINSNRKGIRNRLSAKENLYQS
jgi:hypothetical protein